MILSFRGIILSNDMNNKKNKLISAVSWQMRNKVCSFGMNIIIQIVLARLIAPEDFGSLAILNAIIGFATIFVESGVSTALVQKKDLDGQDIFTAQMISIAVAMLFCGVLIVAANPVAAYYNAPTLATPLCVISVVLIFNSINSVFSALLTRDMEFKKLFFRTVTVLPVSGAIGMILAYKGFGIWALVIYQISTVALNSLVFVIFSHTRLVFRFSWRKAKQIYSFGIKILLSGIVNSVYDTIRTLVIGGKYFKTELAYYDRAYTYSRYTVQIVNSTITSVALPLFSKQQDSLEVIKNFSRRIIRMSAFVMFPVLTGLAAVSRPLILTLLTEKWEACIPFFTIFCFLRIPGVITGVDIQSFYAIGRSDIVLKYSILTLVLNITSLFFVLPYGVLAIAINILVVEIVVSIVIMVISANLIRYSVREKIEDLWKSIINCMILFIVEWMISKALVNTNSITQLIIQIVFGVCIYICVAVIIKDQNIILIRDLLSDKIGRNKS